MLSEHGNVILHRSLAMLSKRIDQTNLAEFRQKDQFGEHLFRRGPVRRESNTLAKSAGVGVLPVPVRRLAVSPVMGSVDV